MRCKKHLYDVSSTVGVCASCLRDRLLLLIEKQSEPPIQLQSISNNSSHNPNCNRRQNQQKQPPPLIFPRSVSPYICPRKSEPIQPFYATPQANINPPKKKLGLIARLFRSRSIKSSSSNSTLISHNSTLISQNSAGLACRNKGMSPESELDYEIDERETTESSPASWMTRPSPARAKPSPARAASLAFCLSPLVRASPARNWRGDKSGTSGEIRVTSTGKCNGKNEGNNGKNRPHLSNVASFCANRSRKLADFGRIWLEEDFRIKQGARMSE